MSTARLDSDLLPWVQDLDGLWHRRPAGRDWFTDRKDGMNAETLCGAWVASTHVSNCDPRSIHDDGPAQVCRPCDDDLWSAGQDMAEVLARIHRTVSMPGELHEAAIRAVEGWQHESGRDPRSAPVVSRPTTGTENTDG